MLFFLEISQYSPISYYKWPENKKSEEKGHRSSEKQPFRHRRPLQTSVVDLGKTTNHTPFSSSRETIKGLEEEVQYLKEKVQEGNQRWYKER